MVAQFAVVIRLASLARGVRVVAAAHAAVTVGASAGKVVGKGQVSAGDLDLGIAAGDDAHRVGHQHAVDAAITGLGRC